MYICVRVWERERGGGRRERQREERVRGVILNVPHIDLGGRFGLLIDSVIIGDGGDDGSNIGRGSVCSSDAFTGTMGAA